MRSAKLTAIAEADLRGIWEYIAEHNAEAANKLIKEITKKFAVLSDFPQIGREQHRLLVNLRSFNVRGYIIFIGRRVMAQVVGPTPAGTWLKKGGSQPRAAYQRPLGC